MHSAFRTPLNDLFDIERPILVGGMMWLSTAEFVAACARAGILAFMTPRSYGTIEAYREGLAKAIDLAGGAPIGVNLTIPRHTAGIPTGEYLRIAHDLGVKCFETAGSAPNELFAAIHEGGGRVIHKCTRPRHALSAVRDGADAIALVGMEAGGHPGTNPHPSHLLAAATLPSLTVPLAIGGGIGTGGQILGALAQGADGVVIGTRMLTSTEIWAHPRYKERLVAAGIDDTTAALRRYGVTWRVLGNATSAKVQEMEGLPETTYSDFGDLVRGRYARDRAYVDGIWEEGMLSCSAAAGFCARVEPVSEIVGQLMREFEQARLRLNQRTRIVHGA